MCEQALQMGWMNRAIQAMSVDQLWIMFTVDTRMQVSR
jgi:hypothetical protein